MTGGPTEHVQQAPGADEQTTAEILSKLTTFDGPPEQFLRALLALQCRIGAAEAGTVLRVHPQGQVDVLAVFPALSRGALAPVWLAESVEAAPGVAAAGNTAVKPLHGPHDLYGQQATRHLVMVPLRGGTGSRGVAAFVVVSEDPRSVAARQQRLELTAGFLSLYEMRLALHYRQLDLERLRAAMELQPAVNDQDRFMAAAMALCNEAAARWACERVSLGFLKGRYVQLRAMSHTEKFSRKMQLVQDIEAAMEECLDQDEEIFYPPSREATYLSRAAEELSQRHGPSVIASFPLRRGGEPVAVLTLERPADRPLNIADVEAIRLACELCSARLVDLRRRDRWFGARAAGAVRHGLAAALGPKHTWKKLAVLGVLALATFLVVAKGDYTAEAPFTLQATKRQVVPAPFDGYLKEVFVDPDADVVGGETTLATLHTDDLRQELAKAIADRVAHEKQADAARKDDNRAEVAIAEAKVAKMIAQIDLLNYRIDQATIRSPISGKVVKGDLKRAIGAPVKTGEVLFEIAPVDSLRAELAMPEDQIADVEDSQEGKLATASYPGLRFGFTVERIDPVAEVVSQRNVFKVRVKLASTAPWMRPGMEGVAKVHLGRRRYAWLWTRRLVNWLRMKLWL